ncbi:lytic murein transglycosylase [Tabrizicola fusiformis]|uniref:lytic murein transglycosylase n=1 Tax=Tabrizicola sp. SY72 TaxID=2741673 RepID=UPI001574C750|nr:lytic murein transglycosylase [Tabrizicola sp. SY72]NTT86736.1 lytic murein transglycosylase [Tabrizicola sp. SY72]
MRAALLALFLAQPALAAPCGGDWGGFLRAMTDEARAAGASDAAIAAFFDGARADSKVLKADRGQGVFRKTFLDFSKSLISKSRLQTGAAKSAEWDAIFARAESEFGVSRGILLAFWAFETDFGAVQGDFNTRNALLTLAHDCRRPEMFQPQVLAAILLTEKHDFDPATTTGAWAGEIGMVQMLPKDILEKGVDGDGDGLITLKTSAPDALLSGANLLRHHGWRAGEPWLQEVTLPETLDWSLTGLQTERPAADWAALGVAPREGTFADLPASLLLPQGRKGPAFLAYPNFKVLFEWNKSFVYVTTAAYFATRLQGAAPYAAGNPDPALSPEEMTALQQALAARGHDVGKIDGILGAATRAAVQAEQSRLGLPADGWPTVELLNAL